MPDVRAHIAAAGQAAEARTCLKTSDEKRHQQWIATIAFYEAMHWIAAVTSALAIPRPPSSHHDRIDLLQTDARLSAYNRNHEKLLNASLIARYLCNSSGTTCDRYFSQKKIMYDIQFVWLKGIRDAAEKQLAELGHEVPRAAVA